MKQSRRQLLRAAVAGWNPESWRKTVRGMLITILAALMLATGCTQTSKDSGKETSAPASSDSGQRTTANTRSGPKAQGACDVLTASDIASILKVAPVKKDEPYSGKNEFTKVDYCYWHPGKFGPEDEWVQVKLYRAPSADEGELMNLFNAAKSDLINSGLIGGQPISGVGDEATYTPYTDGSGGGVIAMRAGMSAVSIRGQVSKDALTSMARAAVQKL